MNPKVENKVVWYGVKAKVSFKADELLSRNSKKPIPQITMERKLSILKRDIMNTKIFSFLLCIILLGCKHTKDHKENTAEEPKEFKEGSAYKHFDDWDQDRNHFISLEEFHDAFKQSEYWSKWDINNDGWLNKDEFKNIVFRFWDKNGDGLIERDEWFDATPVWFGINDHGSFEDWDENNNTFIEKGDEFDQRIDFYKLYDIWDLNNDNKVDFEDFVNFSYVVWDESKDEHIDKKEWGKNYALWFKPVVVSPEKGNNQKDSF